MSTSVSSPSPDTTEAIDAPVALSGSTVCRRLVAEGLGTALLIAIVVGSGIRAERLAAGDTALALLCNALATGAGLVALLVSLGPVSGAHFNPVVSLSNLVQGKLPAREALGYVLMQLTGALVGVMAAHAMFGLPLLSMSTQARTGLPMWWSEYLASFGLVGLAMATGRSRPALVPFVVAAYITAGYWFTASTSFANPALTIACALTNTFTGIRMTDVPGFILAQIIGAMNATMVFHWLCPVPARRAVLPAGWQNRAPGLTSAD